MIQQSLPNEFLEKCSASEREEVESWWRGLNPESRTEVRVLLDRRNDSRAFVFSTDETGETTWRVLPIVDDDLPFDDPQVDEREWKIEYFQHLLAHPEQLLLETKVRTFYICVNHSRAREVAAEGQLSGHFICPAANTECPIQQFAGKIRQATLIHHDRETQRTTWICH